MTGGAAAKAKTGTYDLSAQRNFPPIEKQPRGPVALPEPSALMSLNTDKVLVRQATGETTTLNGVQWSDSLPALFQAKVLASFENAGFLNTVLRQTEGVEADYRLLIEIRSFQILMSPGPTAAVEFSARVAPENGRPIGARMFTASMPAKSTEPAALIAALDDAFVTATTDLVVWAATVLANPPPAKHSSP
jgi:phospholipid/cholesterol/gamma-HCH transport system substrate-binding protein